MKSKKTKSSFDLKNKSYNQLILESFVPCTYEILCNGTYGLESMGTFDNIVDALLFAYGLSEFVIKNDKRLYYQFISDKFTLKQVHNAGFIEPFDFVTHNLLTESELDNFKIRLRTYED